MTTPAPQLDSAIQLLKELVEMDSGTSNITGVNQVIERVARELSFLGMSCQLLDNPKGAHLSGQLLIATYEPATAPTKKKTFVDLVTHADTVFETASGFTGFVLDQAQGIAKGPGVIDDKGGIVVAIAALREILPKWHAAKTGIPVRLICTPSEETGSPGFHEVLKKLGESSRLALGLEPAMDDGSLIGSRRGNRWYCVHVQGEEAHVGRNAHQGINAAHELAHKITEFARLDDRTRGITVSTGAISGGDKFNIVCGKAEAKVDVRFEDFKSRDATHAAIEKIIAQPHLTANDSGKLPSARFEIADDCPPVPPADGEVLKIQTLLLKHYGESLKLLEGTAPRTEHSGGAADVNYMSRPGLVILDGLGPVGGGMHRTDEWIRLESLKTRSLALAALLDEVASSGHAYL